MDSLKKKCNAVYNIYTSFLWFLKKSEKTTFNFSESLTNYFLFVASLSVAWTSKFNKMPFHFLTA